jgi:hypothetical protein
MVDEAWERLNKSYVYFKGKPVGTLAAMDTSADALNYNQVSNSISCDFEVLVGCFHFFSVSISDCFCYLRKD